MNAISKIYLTIGATALLAMGQNVAGAQISFNDQVRPILSNHCYACHGPDEEKREAGLRLDVAGDADMEEVLERIASDDEDYMMPPPSHQQTAQRCEKEHAAKVDRGRSSIRKHWAFALPTKNEVPANVHPVDHFVNQKLKANGLEASPQADPATLIRRLYLDLVGLPPTLTEAQKLLTNRRKRTGNQSSISCSSRLDTANAGRGKWLDLARYADTNGYEKDRDRSIWPYRDWVIRAINDGMPFDQFTVEQLAGDMLPDPTQSQLVATGFHRNTMLNEEGGIDPLEFRFHAMTDRVATTGTTWLGLTTGCAQCHTHKFDPITHEDYFGMMAYMNNADEPDLFLTDENSAANQEKNRKQAEKLTSELESKWPKSTEEKKHPQLKPHSSRGTRIKKQTLSPWKTIVPTSMSTNMVHLFEEANGAIFAIGDITKADTYTLNFPAVDQPISAIRLEALPDVRLPAGGPGLTYYEGRKGDFFLTEIEATIGDQVLPWKEASSTYAGNAFGKIGQGAPLAIDGDIQSGWSVAGRVGTGHIAVFNFESPLPAGKPFTVTMKFGRHFASSLGKFRLSVVNSENPLTATLLENDSKEDAKRAFLMQASELKEHSDKIRKLLQPLQGNSTLVMKERQQGYERKTFLHHRGEYTQPKQEVNPRLPEAVFDNESQPLPKNRLEFAQWLVSPKNPLTSRVVANRQWAAFFGTGIVKTVDDFGMQGESPSHPELLDYLAVELIESGWSTKQLHRLIVTSETYRRSSKFDKVDVNAERLLQRFPRRRLEAEVIRDSALAAAGLLATKMFGPPVRPPQPAGVSANYSKTKWEASKGADRFRRSIYTYQKRTAPFAMFTTFDASSGESCVARRDASNTPLQALTLMNDPMFVEISEALGKRMKDFEGSTEAKIEVGVSLVADSESE